MGELVRLRMRPSHDGRSLSYFLDYIDPNGKRLRTSLGHTDQRKTQAEQAKAEKQLRMGAAAPESMRLSEFVAQSLTKTGDQIRESTRQGYEATMKEFIAIIGDKDWPHAKQPGETHARLAQPSPCTPASLILSPPM